MSNSFQKWLLMCVSTTMAATTTSIPTMTIHGAAGSKVYSLPLVSSLTFNDGTVAVRKVRPEFCGFRISGQTAGSARFTLTGTPNTPASIQLIELNGRTWSGSVQLDAAGKGSMNVPTPRGGMVVVRYRNVSFIQTAPVPLIGGGRR